MMTVDLHKEDKRYLGIILNRVLVCKEYKPAFGQGQKVALQEFEQLYGSDPFYSWFGLNDPLVYAAHRAAGGITSAKRNKVSRWLGEAASKLDVAPEVIRAFQGIVFEIRQGYKSKDSKRQNADIANAATAYSQGYFPVLLVLSTQIDADIVEQYEHAKWSILQGQLVSSPLYSTYAFTKEVVGYDLAGFFQCNSATLQATVAGILHALLGTDAHDG
jgi:hypothetical protein